MTGIFLLAALLWVTEALPLFATALLVIALQVLLLANPGDWAGLGFERGGAPSFQNILEAAADPVIVVFFGGFLLARAAVKEGLDGVVASVILRPFRGRPSMVLLGVLAATAMFSMWMSNTAAAAMMITLVAPLSAAMPAGEPFRKALVLAVAFAANIGGMATPIGSPPNAVAVGYLHRSGYPITFVEWMVLAVPLMVGLLAVTWGVLWILFRPRAQGFVLPIARTRMTPRGWYVAALFAATAALWLTEPWHGLPAAAVALLPAVALTASGLLDRNDLNRLDWSVLILIAGGISLGAGVRMSGLDQIVVAWLNTGGTPRVAMTILTMLTLVTLGLSTFMSNTAAANLLLPIAMSFATAIVPETGRVAIQFAICVALTASVSMALPVSTPPNAIAYAGGEVRTIDMLAAGGAIGLVAIGFIIIGSGSVVEFWGLGR